MPSARPAAQSDHFGVGRGVVVAQDAILRPRQHRILIDEHCAHRHLTRLPGSDGFVQRHLNVFEIGHS